jgi:uncharacterized glyoxalase superfamily protein PhnB
VADNRSMPAAGIIPVLAYDDVSRAVAWLRDTFGFRERLLIGDHRAQLTFGDGAIVVVRRTEPAPAQAGAGKAGKPRAAGSGDHSTMVRVADVDAHHARVKAAGAWILQPPTDHVYGERQYSVVDLGGHAWTFSQSIADVHPRAWGGDLRDSRAD